MIRAVLSLLAIVGLVAGIRTAVVGALTGLIVMCASGALLTLALAVTGPGDATSTPYTDEEGNTDDVTQR